MSNPLNFALRLVYGVYAWSCFALLGVLTLLLLMVVPGTHRRRNLAQLAARSLLRLTGIQYRLEDAQLLPVVPCVVVANHSSYLDGVLMTAALPSRFSFVIKKEMIKVPLAGLLLRRIGALFVDRNNRHAGGMDTRRIMRDALAGQSMVFFPEGTFTHRIGLQAFHQGAFVTAQRAGIPVVPVAIHGARRVLRPGSPWPRPGRIRVRVLGVLHTPTRHKDRNVTETLRDQARARLLLALEEPDLLTDAGPDDLRSGMTSSRTSN